MCVSGPTFRTYKITSQIAEIHVGIRDYMLIGDPNTKRDWGHVRDFVRGMWLSLQIEKPDDYIFATGVTHSIKDFVNCGFGAVGRELLYALAQDIAIRANGTDTAV